ncbi:MAG TPA: aminotransferase class I/II-fold pyridoxal phosphate-dependent enzyme [Vicinamibacterales bacterium]|nr:aminotransferase class I/II-fold pyridoxal phosphate-dependent enzyme [Vicinamibacterales bacterium]
MHFATRAIHAAQSSDASTGALIAPIYQTSTFEQESPGVNLGFDYSRTNNPTRQRLENVLAALEGVDHCAVFASGLAAEHAVLHAYLRPRDEIVVPVDVYGGTFRLLTRVFASFDLTVIPVDTTDLDAVRAAVGARTRLVWLESPTNPRLIVSDIGAIAEIAHRHDVRVVVDNTFATPVFQQPFALGADVVVHSVTKYLAGHSDLIQGAVLAKDAAIFEPIRFLQNAIGAVPAPLDCWLTLRGLKTLELRMQRHAENASRIADALRRHDAVARVYYPGFGGMVSFELRGTIDQVKAFVSQRRFFALGESLGGVKSLICHPATMTHASIPASHRARVGLSDALIRLSPGIEHADDLIADLTEGLDAVQGKLGRQQWPDISSLAQPASSAASSSSS